MTPQLIKSVTDGSILQFDKVVKVPKGSPLLQYKYIQSETKAGQVVSFTAENLDKLILNNIFVEPKPTTT